MSGDCPCATAVPDPVKYDQHFEAAADITLDASERFLIVPDMKAGTLTWLPVKP